MLLEAEVADDAEHAHQGAVPAVVATNLGAVGPGEDLNAEGAELKQAYVRTEAHRAAAAGQVPRLGLVGEGGERGVVLRRQSLLATVGSAQQLPHADGGVLEHLRGDEGHAVSPRSTRRCCGSRPS